MTRRNAEFFIGEPTCFNKYFGQIAVIVSYFLLYLIDMW